MKKHKLPTHKECLKIINQHHVPEHIIRHSLATAKLAVFLAERLKEKGKDIDITLVESASLLHDFVRACDFNNFDNERFEREITPQEKTKWKQIRQDHQHIPHEYIAYELLKNEYPELALTIKKHRYLSLLDTQEKPETWEEKLVYYADKRVMHDRIVPLSERLEEAHNRYRHMHQDQPKKEIQIQKVDALIYELQEQIFTELDIKPDQVTDEFIDSF